MPLGRPPCAPLLQQAQGHQVQPLLSTETATGAAQPGAEGRWQRRSACQCPPPPHRWFPSTALGQSCGQDGPCSTGRPQSTAAPATPGRHLQDTLCQQTPLWLTDSQHPFPGADKAPWFISAHPPPPIQLLLQPQPRRQKLGALPNLLQAGSPPNISSSGFYFPPPGKSFSLRRCPPNCDRNSQMTSSAGEGGRDTSPSNGGARWAQERAGASPDGAKLSPAQPGPLAAEALSVPTHK